MDIITIAIDGPSGAGKSTIAKRLANELGFTYLDTGAMYRAITQYVIEHDIDPEDEEAVSDTVDHVDVQLDGNSVFLNGEDVTKQIRSKEVTALVSLVSSYAAVRQHMLHLQRMQALQSSSILDGRDIGTHVLPDATIKFYLTASVEERARRRFEQIKDSQDVSFEWVKADIERRDHFDSNRKVAPLRRAEDAILIDSTNMNIDEVVQKMKEYVDVL